MTEKKVVFLFGGPGAEHEVSLATAQSALPAFEDQFLLLPVFITRDQKWVVSQDFVPASEIWPVAQKIQSEVGIPAEVALDAIEAKLPDVVFIGLHGEYGEDGTLQALLEARGLSFPGSRWEASALAMDKPKVLQLLQDEDIAVPDFLEVSQETADMDMQAFIDFHGYPVVVLPANRGSSVGVTLVRSDADLVQALKDARDQSDKILITRYIAGKEVTCGLLVTSTTDLEALPPTEIIPAAGHDFFDYDAKYNAAECKEVTPPLSLSVEAVHGVQAVAKRVHQLIGADGYSRVDMIVDEQDKIYVLEINTLPGLTATSLLPQQADAAGYSLGELLTVLCTNIDRSETDYRTVSVGGDEDEELPSSLVEV